MNPGKILETQLSERKIECYIYVLSFNIWTKISSVSSRTALFTTLFMVLDKHLASEVGSCSVCCL